MRKPGSVVASIGALGAFDLGSSPGRATIFLKELECSVSETTKFGKTFFDQLYTASIVLCLVFQN